MNVVDTWGPTCENLHTFGDTCIAVMLLPQRVSVGAIGGNDHKGGMRQIRSGTMNL